MDPDLSPRPERKAVAQPLSPETLLPFLLLNPAEDSLPYKLRQDGLHTGAVRGVRTSCTTPGGNEVFCPRSQGCPAFRSDTWQGGEQTQGTGTQGSSKVKGSCTGSYNTTHAGKKRHELLQGSLPHKIHYRRREPSPVGLHSRSFLLRACKDHLHPFRREKGDEAEIVP